MSSAPAFAGSAKRAITVSSPGNTAAASGATPLSTTVKTTTGAPLAGEAVSLTGPARSIFAAANGTTNGSGVYTTNFDVNRSWAWPGSTATVTALTGGESGSAALTILGANAYRLGSGGGRPNNASQYWLTTDPIQEDRVFPSPIVAMSAGRAAAVLRDGTYWTPGGTTWEKNSALSDIISTSSSQGHSVAVTSAGELYAWGSNSRGQLGLGHNTDVSTPTKVPGMNDVKMASAGAGVTFVVKNDGTLWTVGGNYRYQLGVNANPDPSDANYYTRSTFAQMTTLTDVKQVSAGFLYGCVAVKNDGTVWAWGSNVVGQLCDGTTTSSPLPKQIPGLTGIVQVQGNCSRDWYEGTTGWALKGDGTLWGWASNGHGQLGNGTTINSPTPVQFATDIKTFGSGPSAIWAIKTDGVTVVASGNCKCAGVEATKTPVTFTLDRPVTAMSEIISQAYDNQRVFLITGETSVSVDVVQAQVSAGTAGTVNVTVSAGSAGVARTGVGLSATVGTLTAASGTTSSSGAFQTTITPDAWTTPGTIGRVTADTDASTGSDTFTVLGANLLHDNGTSAAQVPRQFASPIVRAQAGAGREWILLKDGTVWSRNGGDGAFTQVPGITDGVDLTASSAAGGTYWVLNKDGTVWGWGDNSSGQLGDGTTTNTWDRPVLFNGLTGVTKIAAAAGTLFAIRSDKTLWAAGANNSGKAGVGSTTTPIPLTQVSGGTDVVDVVGRFRGATMVKADGTVWSWGEGANGDVGDGQTTDRLSPVQLTTLGNIASLAGGITKLDWYTWTTFALTNTGAVYVWGSNASGAYGNNTTSNSTTPVQITGLSGVAQIAVSNNAVLALKNDGTMLKWGGRASTPTAYTATRPVARLSNANAGAYNDRVFLITK